jgi:hypothetical protein
VSWMSERAREGKSGGGGVVKVQSTEQKDEGFKRQEFLLTIKKDEKRYCRCRS